MLSLTDLFGVVSGSEMWGGFSVHYTPRLGGTSDVLDRDIQLSGPLNR
jgi:hypothetical protein